MSNLLQQIIIPQLHFEGADDSAKFVKLFSDLYRVELFKDGLDLILTKLQEGKLRFEVKIIKGWDTNVGCFLTENKNLYDAVLGKFFQKRDLKIILRSLHYNVLAHEMAHALEFESGIDLGEEFRKAIGYDMNGREPQIITLKAEKQRLMVDALKAYKPEQFLSELFARYFELLSISRNVIARGDFATSDVMKFFENTTNFIEKIFNPKIRKKIDPKISAITNEIAAEVKLSAPEQKFQERITSTQKKSGGQWSKGIRSNAAWQESWNKTKELGEKK